MFKKNKFISKLSSPPSDRVIRAGFRKTEGVWLSGCLFVFAMSCENTSNYNHLKLTPIDSAQIELKNEKAVASIKNAKSIIQQGDMIVRTGNDFTSESLRKLSFTDKTYSHCGIASIENDTIFIYHALGGEWNPDEKLRRDPLELFCNPIENRGFGIFSFKFDMLQKAKLDSIIKAWYKKGLMFDMKFDLTTNDRMYCAEFVCKAISLATNSSINFSTTKINNFEFVAVDNLFLNGSCIEKLRIRY